MLTLLKAGQDQVKITFDTDYQAVLNRATALLYTLPSYYQQVLQNQIIIDLKAAGVWAKLDVFYNFANDGSAEFATLNWKNPNLNQASLVNGMAFAGNEGFFGPTSSNAYIDTNFAPSSGVQYQQNNASRYLYLFSFFGANALDGLPDVAGNSMFRSNSTSQRINQGTTTPLNLVFDFTANRGMKSIHRTSST